MIEAIGAVTDPYRSRDTLYAIAAELGLKIKKSNCKKCAKDAWNIIREELGMIASAADESDFNGYEYIYLPKRAQSWNGHLIDQDTPVEVIREFVKQFPNGYYRKAERNDNNNQD